jgi:hypothetical protein
MTTPSLERVNPLPGSERTTSRRHYRMDRLRQPNRESDFLRGHRCDQQIWPAAGRIAAWMHETALRLFPDSPYAKAHKA